MKKALKKAVAPKGKAAARERKEEQLDLFLPGGMGREAAVVSRWNEAGEPANFGPVDANDRNFNEWWAEQRAAGGGLLPVADGQTDLFKPA